MGKVICDVVTSDTSGDEQRKTVREKQKNRTKKKKRKRDLTDLHQKIFKSKKDKKTKIDGKLGTRSSKRISNRILPKALSGIYRNGATGKEIRRSQTKLPLDNLNNARLEGNVLKLLDGYDSKSEDVVKNNTNEISKNILFDSAIKNILQPTPVSKQDTSPVLGNTDGKKRYDKDDYIKDFNISNTEFLQKQLEKKKPIDSKNLGDSALRKYEELCIDIFLENFEEPNFPDHLGTDPLIKQQPKYENNQKCDNNQHVYYVMVDQCKDSNNLQKCSHDNVSQIEKPRTLHNGRLCQEDVTDVSILKGVHNLKILPVEEQESQIKFIDNQYIQNGIELEQQPIKYLAFENDSKTQKVPIYKHVTSVDNVEVTNSNANYRVISCLQEPTQKIIFVPTCEQNKVVYVEQQNLGHSNVAFEEQYSHPKKIILYRPEVQPINDSSNVCEIHVPKQNVVEIRKTDCEPIVTTLHHTDKAIKSRRNVVNWEELHYRPNYEHNACVKSQAVFYQK
ncbi:bromodomain-containing protein [Apis mellifera caucasica]|nr:bromodomain-containing protein [Apis mellifera caucasica]